MTGLVYATTWLVNRSLRRVEGPSMLPSLWPGDLLVSVPVRWVRPRSGDVVVAEVGGRRVTKRLAAPPGVPVELRDGHVWVEGTWWATPDAVHVDEDVAWDPPCSSAVLLGDHRARSTDARTIGPVATGALDRVALARLRPWAWLRGRTHPVGEERIRHGVRLVVLDPDDRVLLFRVADAGGDDRTWWEAPGGGRHQGEPPHAAATREFEEEVGAPAPAVVPLGEVHVRRTVLAGGGLRKVEDLYAVRVESAEVDDRRWTATEVRDIVEHRWWTPEELATLDPATVAPSDIARLAALASARV